MTVRDELHLLVDALPEDDLPTARRLLATLTPYDDPLGRFLAAAPDDDEPSSPEQDRAAAEGRAAMRRGERISAADAKRALLP